MEQLLLSDAVAGRNLVKLAQQCPEPGGIPPPDIAAKRVLFSWAVATMAEAHKVKLSTQS